MNLKALAYQLREDTINMIRAGKAGHIGGDMSVMEILVELYFDQMNISPENMDDPDRDLFVLSKGHSMEAYYAVLAAKGFLDLEDVTENFSKFGSKYIGHPNNKLPGIAEQNLVSIAAGLAKCGKKSYAVSPASFLSTRSYEQCKVDVAYSDTNVKLIGISGGISYGALGMSHHSAQDIAAMSAIPNMRVYIPSDHLQTAQLMKALLKDEKPAYIRVGRNAVDPVYEEGNVPFEMDRATVVTEGSKEGNDVAIIAYGEMVKPAKDAAEILKRKGIHASVLDMYCVKPLDEEAVIRAARKAKAVLTVEEHAPFGGLGSMVAQVVGRNCPRKVVTIALPDVPVITGTSKKVFDYYGMNAEGIAEKAAEAAGAAEAAEAPRAAETAEKAGTGK